MEINEILNLIRDVAGWVISLTSTIIIIVKAIKNKDFKKFCEEVEKNIIPLMEQAEGFFVKAEDKENWVLNKLADKMHIDFYKYKKKLEIARTIIQKICNLTKTNVNKILIFENKQEETKQEQKGTYTNGIA